MHKSLLLAVFVGTFTAEAQVLELPPRKHDAPTGSEFAASVRDLPTDEREKQIFGQIAGGNVPAFLRHLVPVSALSADSQHTLTYYVTPDYLAIGSDEDYLLIPMTPILAQAIADTTRCSLPTKKMVNDIYQAASLKLAPQPIPPSAAMITTGVFVQHNDSVWRQRSPLLSKFPLGVLVGGHKKDVILSNSIRTNLKPGVPRPVVIYGWHRLDGTPIQPPYNGHGGSYADYSHGIRLVQQEMMLDGRKVQMDSVLRNPALCGLLSDEGMIDTPRYDTARKE